MFEKKSQRLASCRKKICSRNIYLFFKVKTIDFLYKNVFKNICQVKKLIFLIFQFDCSDETSNYKTDQNHDLYH